MKIKEYIIFILSNLGVKEVNDGILKPIGKEYIFQELVNPIHNRKDNQVTVSLTVEYIDQQTKATQVSQFDLVLEKNGSNWKIIE